MSEPPRPADTGDDTGMQYEDEPTGIPRWVKVAGIVVALLALLVVVVMLLGGGHGPRRHTMPGDLHSAPAASITAVRPA